MILNLGVLDVAYGDAHGGTGATTTAEVATILEDRYAVMGTFYELYKTEIGEMLAGSVADAVDVLVSTGRHVIPTLEAEQRIEAEFRAFLDRDEMSKLAAGLSEGEAARFRTFSAAAQAGVSHRKKHPYAKKNKTRAAFVDTGLYRQSFKAWVEE